MALVFKLKNNFILRFIKKTFKQCYGLYKSQNIGIIEKENSGSLTENQEKVLFHLETEKNKARFDLTINEEYSQKVIMYGYVVVN